MKRAQIDAFCGCRETLYQRIAFFAAPAILLAGIVYVAVRYAQLPAEIPSHYNFYGEIDGYGSRGTLWIMPIIGILCDALMLAVSFFPQTWNVGTSVTVFNRALVYRRVRDLIADIRLSMAVMFTVIAVCGRRRSRRPSRGGWACWSAYAAPRRSCGFLCGWQ